jgi:hypothetical protein
MMIEKSYSAYIADHADAISRRALLDTAVPAAAANVVKIRLALLCAIGLAKPSPISYVTEHITVATAPS